MFSLRDFWQKTMLILIIVRCHVAIKYQCSKKVVSDSPGLVDFAIELVNSVLNLPDGQVKFFEEFK